MIVSQLRASLSKCRRTTSTAFECFDFNFLIFLKEDAFYLFLVSCLFLKIFVAKSQVMADKIGGFLRKTFAFVFKAAGSTNKPNVTGMN